MKRGLDSGVVEKAHEGIQVEEAEEEDHCCARRDVEVVENPW